VRYPHSGPCETKRGRDTPIDDDKQLTAIWLFGGTKGKLQENSQGLRADQLTMRGKGRSEP